MGLKAYDMNSISVIQSPLFFDTISQDREDRHQVLRAMQAAYETHDPEVANKVANALFLDGKIRLQDMPLTAVDLLGIISMVESHKQISEIW